MTTIDTTAQSAPAMTGGFIRVLGNLANGLAAHWVRREAIKLLQAMDDRELRDLGIPRSHIEDAVRGRFDPAFGRVR